MKKRRYTIIYAAFILLLLIIALVFRNLNDMVWMLMAILALFATSIYTYSTRK